MNTHQFDAKIIAAGHDSDHTNTFVKQTMQKIRALSRPAVPFWHRLAMLPPIKRVALGVSVALIVSTLSFSGYAYATGTDPISLIKRWIEGDKVKIEYQGRTFEHGKTRSYSDAAVTALAEFNTVEGLAFHAENQLQVPKDGVEHVSLPQGMRSADSWQEPYFATITAVDGANVTLQKQYLWGNKMQPSRELDESVTVPAAEFSYYVRGEPVAATAGDTGKLVAVFARSSLRHEIATNKIAKVITHFSFALSHPLADFKEASVQGPVESGEKQPMFESNWGGLSNICLNNGADTCDLHTYSKKENHGLFLDHPSFIIRDGPKHGLNSYNPQAIAFGEAVATQDQQPADLISRGIMGEIASLDDAYITLKTSSGALWKLAYTKANRDAFAARAGQPLKVGDKLIGLVLESVYTLGNRTIDNQHLQSLERYQ